MIGPGSTIRDIRLVEQLGSGGMGEVWVGHQEHLERDVAVKAIRAERRLDGAARARFLREARILSRLEHPNICRLYDHVEVAGQDFLVLELVRGRSLRELLDGSLDDGSRLEIAEQVAAALAAAHGISVVHRDLKPENIMVTGDGTVKVLDFGLARRTQSIEAPLASEAGSWADDEIGSSSSADADWTMLGDVLGTPRYMSPEQARGEALTAASDMYAFGLLLQELWTGEPPYGEGLTAAETVQKAMWGEIAPATGLDTQVAGLIGDLTAFEPGRRPSAAAAAERLRWIRERPLRRARRRALIAVIAALAVAAAASTAGFIIATQSQRRAEAARAEAESVNEFLRNMLASAAPDREGIDTRVVEVLDSAAARVEEDFADHPLSRASVHSTLGRTYLSLGLWEQAREQLERTVEIRRAELGADDRATLTAEMQVAVAMTNQGLHAEAEQLLREVHSRCREALGDDDGDTVAASANLAIALQKQYRLDEAEPMVRREVAWKRATFGDEDDRTLNARLSLANLLARSGRNEEAVAEYRQLLAIRRRVFGEDHPDTLAVASNLAVQLSRNASTASEAMGLFEEVVERRRRVLGHEHPETLRTLDMQAVQLRRLGRLDEAEALCREVFESRRRTLGSAHPDTIVSEMSLAVVLSKLQRFTEAEELLRSSLARAERTVGLDHPITLNILGNLGNFLIEQDRPDEAEKVHRRLLEVAGRTLGDDHPKTISVRNGLATVLVRRGRVAEAETVFRELLAACERIFGPDHPRTRQARRDLAALLRDTGQPEEAAAVEAAG